MSSAESFLSMLSVKNTVLLWQERNFDEFYIKIVCHRRHTKHDPNIAVNRRAPD